MSKSSLVAVAILASSLGFLCSEPKAGAASFGAAAKVLKGIADSKVLDEDNSSVQQVHYSRRFGWHCGMWEYYGHSHPEFCWRGRYGGPGGYWGGGGWRYHHYRDHDYRDHDGDRRDHDRDGDHDHDRDQNRHKGDHDRDRD